MVEKIDRLNPPPPYRVAESRETQDDQQGRQQQQEQESQEPSSAWGKFHGSDMSVIPQRLASQTIAHCIFRNVSLKHGMPLLICDIELRDGNRIAGVLMSMPRLEEYFRLKTLFPGQEVPRELWEHGPDIEIGVLRMNRHHASHPLSQMKAAVRADALRTSRSTGRFSVYDRVRGTIIWSNVISYSVGLLILAIIAFEIFFR